MYIAYWVSCRLKNLPYSLHRLSNCRCKTQAMATKMTKVRHQVQDSVGLNERQSPPPASSDLASSCVWASLSVEQQKVKLIELIEDPSCTADDPRLLAFVRSLPRSFRQEILLWPETADLIAEYKSQT